MATPTFQLLRDEDSGEGLRRIVAEQVDWALHHVQQASPGAEDVHEYRRVCKRVRAVLRLVRLVDRERYRRENAAFRDAARLISPLRSTSVMAETIRLLVDSGGVGAASVELLIEHTTRASQGLRDEILGHQQELVATMTDARQRLSTWSLPPQLIPTTMGLQRTYARGRRAWVTAYAAPTDASFHRWRKRAKYLQHQTELLSAVSSEVGELALCSGAISRGLGKHQDLADLSALIGATPSLFGSERDQRQLTEAIERHQAALRTEVGPLGQEFYAETGPEFTARMTGYWLAWRDAP